MKTTNRYIVNAGNIRSMKDLELEKQRLRLEILNKEHDIHSSYHNIVQSLMPANLGATMMNEMSSSKFITKAFSFGKSLMAKRKKKKHDKLKETTGDPQS